MVHKWDPGSANISFQSHEWCLLVTNINWREGVFNKHEQAQTWSLSVRVPTPRTALWDSAREIVLPGVQLLLLTVPGNLGGLPTCGLFCSREEGNVSETAPPCLVVRLFLCLGMLFSALTASTSPGGAGPLEPCLLGGKRASMVPTPTWSLAGTAGGTQNMWLWGLLSSTV